MKTAFKIGAAALALSMMASASAFAQSTQTNTAPTDAAPATAAPAGQGMTSGAPPVDSQSLPPTSGQGAATPDTTSQGAMQGGATASAAETADTPAGSPPSTYPACKHKGEDRCVQEASNSGMHHMKRHMMKSKKATDTTSDMSGASAPATPPAPSK
jgi:hypothetical protein